MSAEPRAAAPDSTPPADAPRGSVYLAPGQLFASAQPAEASTILGSCVAVCLWDPRTRAGGANHFLLPHWGGGERTSTRFGNVAIAELLDRLARMGARTADLQAKVFGGAAVLEAFRHGDHLGLKNVEAARRILRESGVRVVAEDVGGHRGRKLVFRTDSGVALVRLIQEGR